MVGELSLHLHSMPSTAPLSVIILVAFSSLAEVSLTPQQPNNVRWKPAPFIPMSNGDRPPNLPPGTSKVMQAGDEYIFESPGFRKTRYPNSARIKWKFQSDGCNMGITCADFQLIEFLCVDRLVIVDNNGTITRYCGKKGPKDVSVSDSVTIYFISSRWFSDVGFRCKMVCTERKQRPGLLTFSATTANTTDCICGKNPGRDLKGDVAKNEFSWTAALVRKGGSVPFCSGTLINSRYILTAAHCVQKRAPFSLEVLLYSNMVDSDGGNFVEVRRTADNILIHKHFTSRLDYDAALIRLSEEVDISGKQGSFLTPACLPTEEETYDGENATTIALKPISSKNGQQIRAQFLRSEVHAMSNKKCKGYHPTVTDRMLCAQKPLKGACQGDTGGPLLVRRSIERSKNPRDLEGSTQHVQIGIVSWGQGCGARPAVYTRVTELIQWISINTRDAQYCSN